MRYYTVTGLRDQRSELLVAAVLEGKHNIIGDNDTPGYRRWCRHVVAADPDEAEKFATEDHEPPTELVASCIQPNDTIVYDDDDQATVTAVQHHTNGDVLLHLDDEPDPASYDGSAILQVTRP